MVVMHHPPFSASDAPHGVAERLGADRTTRDRMVRALHDAGISIIASGHEHSYQRALLTWPDAVLIAIVSGGAGAPLHQIPPPAESAAAVQRVQGGRVGREARERLHRVRCSTSPTYVCGSAAATSTPTRSTSKSKATLIDEVQIDLNRYGIPDRSISTRCPYRRPRGRRSHEAVPRACGPCRRRPQSTRPRRASGSSRNRLRAATKRELGRCAIDVHSQKRPGQRRSTLRERTDMEE